MSPVHQFDRDPALLNFREYLVGILRLPSSLHEPEHVMLVQSKSNARLMPAQKKSSLLQTEHHLLLPYTHQHDWKSFQATLKYPV